MYVIFGGKRDDYSKVTMVEDPVDGAEPIEMTDEFSFADRPAYMATIVNTVNYSSVKTGPLLEIAANVDTNRYLNDLLHAFYENVKKPSLLGDNRARPVQMNILLPNEEQMKAVSWAVDAYGPKHSFRGTVRLPSEPPIPATSFVDVVPKDRLKVALFAMADEIDVDRYNVDYKGCTTYQQVMERHDAIVDEMATGKVHARAVAKVAYGCETLEQIAALGNGSLVAMLYDDNDKDIIAYAEDTLGKRLQGGRQVAYLGDGLYYEGWQTDDQTDLKAIKDDPLLTLFITESRPGRADLRHDVNGLVLYVETAHCFYDRCEAIALELVSEHFESEPVE